MFDVKEMVEIMQSPPMPAKLASLLASSLKGEPIEKAILILAAGRKVGPALGRVLGRACDMLLALPIGKLGKMIGASTPATASAGTSKTVKASKTLKVSVAKTAKFKKVGKTVVRKDGRSFTHTAKVTAARKLQGQYIGGMRGLPEKLTVAVKKVAEKHDVKTAVSMIALLKAGKSVQEALAAVSKKK